jgi:hypothetical protein
MTGRPRACLRDTIFAGSPATISSAPTSNRAGVSLASSTTNEPSSPCDLPTRPTGDDEYYVFELIGLKVEEEGGAELGIVTDVLPGVANDVLQLDSGLSLPMVEDCVRAVDLAEGRILIAPGFVMPS